MKAPVRAIWSMAVLGGVLLGLYSLFVEPDRLWLSRVRRSVPGMTGKRRVLLISDLHLRPYSRRTYRRIARAAAWSERQGARCVLIAGDLLEDDREAEVVARRLRAALGALRALYVTGNHEAMRTHQRWPFRANDPDVIAAAMSRHRIERIDGRAVDLGGVAVVGIGWPGRGVGAPAAIAGVLQGLDGPAIVLAHSPDHVRGLPADRVIVALCGHTHGGQVRLPLIGAPWIPVRAALPRFAGSISLDGIAAYVSRGIGQTVPVRLGAVPEATLVELAG